MPLHSLPPFANPREARASRASSPYRFARTRAQHPRAQGDPSSSVLRDWPHRAQPAASAASLIGDIRERSPGTSVPGSSREERGRPDWSRTMAGARREQLRRVLGSPSRLRDRVLGEQSRACTCSTISAARSRARPRSGARDRASPAAQGAGGARARRAKRAPPNRAVAQVLSSQTSGCQPRSPNPETSR
jgi:hypothetical protein